MPAAVLMAAMLIHGVKPGTMIMIESPQSLQFVLCNEVLRPLSFEQQCQAAATPGYLRGIVEGLDENA